MRDIIYLASSIMNNLLRLNIENPKRLSIYPLNEIEMNIRVPLKIRMPHKSLVEYECILDIRRHHGKRK
jgi:hypothetical protein